MSSLASSFFNSSTTVVVLGLGRSGLAAARLLKSIGTSVTVADSNVNERLQEQAEILSDEGINVLLGSSAVDDSTIYDHAILSPGIEESSALVVNVIRKKIPLMGELELAYSFCKCPIIAITGSNGKTTTTELTTLVLNAAGLKAIACGNIGLPFSEVILQNKELDIIVVEASSFQLETVDRFHAHIAVWLNFSPNHLDRYTSLEEYRKAKMRVFRNQTSKDFVILPQDFDQRIVSTSAAQCLTFSAKKEGADFSFYNDAIYFRGQHVVSMSETSLRGAHNAENLMAAFAVGIALQKDLSVMAKAVVSYSPPPHRCEVVAVHNGVTWINDSKATTLDAMEKALLSVDKKRSLILIAGGKNKGFSFREIFPLVQERVKQAILIGEMGDIIISEWQGVPCLKAVTMEDAVSKAAGYAQKGDTILLSPGTSSYDMFRDYIERGDSFKKYVQQFITTQTTEK